MRISENYINRFKNPKMYLNLFLGAYEIGKAKILRKILIHRRATLHSQVPRILKTIATIIF